MTIAVDMGRKATKTNKQNHVALHSVLALGASSSGFSDNHSKEIALTCISIAQIS